MLRDRGLNIRDILALSTALLSARQSSVRPANVPSESQHAQTVKGLDVQSASLVKAIEEGEAMLNQKEAEYAELKAELKELEGKDAAEAVELDGDAYVSLPLKTFVMGF